MPARRRRSPRPASQNAAVLPASFRLSPPHFPGQPRSGIMMAEIQVPVGPGRLLLSCFILRSELKKSFLHIFAGLWFGTADPTTPVRCHGCNFEQKNMSRDSTDYPVAECRGTFCLPTNGNFGLVCFYYCRTYYKPVLVGGRRVQDMWRDDEPRPVSISLPIRLGFRLRQPKIQNRDWYRDSNRESLHETIQRKIVFKIKFCTHNSARIFSLETLMKY